MRTANTLPVPPLLLQVAHLVATCAVAGPLVYAAVAKLLSPAGFSVALPQYRLSLPSRPATAQAVGLLELVVAGALIAVVRWESAALCAGAYLGFAFVVERARRLGASGDCGCFGSLASRIDRGAVLRNVGLGIAAGLISLGRALSQLPEYGASAGLVAAVMLLLGTAVLDTVVTVRRTLGR